MSLLTRHQVSLSLLSCDIRSLRNICMQPLWPKSMPEKRWHWRNKTKGAQECHAVASIGEFDINSLKLHAQRASFICIQKSVTASKSKCSQNDFSDLTSWGRLHHADKTRYWITGAVLWCALVCFSIHWWCPGSSRQFRLRIEGGLGGAVDGHLTAQGLESEPIRVRVLQFRKRSTWDFLSKKIRVAFRQIHSGRPGNGWTWGTALSSVKAHKVLWVWIASASSPTVRGNAAR